MFHRPSVVRLCLDLNKITGTPSTLFVLRVSHKVLEEWARSRESLDAFSHSDALPVGEAQQALQKLEESKKVHWVNGLRLTW